MKLGSTVALALVVLLLVAAAWLTFDNGGEIPAGPMLTAEVANPANVDDAVHDVLVAEAATDDAERVDDELVDDGLDGPRRQEVAVEQDDGGPVLRVVDAASKRPVAHAEVLVGNPEAEWRARRQGDGVQHWADLLERHVQPRIADERGEVVLPTVRRRVLVAARAPGLFGVATVRAQDQQPVVELVPDRLLRVRVVDAGGTPLTGVAVALCASADGSVQRRSRAVTEADGIAVLRHVQLFETRVSPDSEGKKEAQVLRERMAQLQMRSSELQLRMGFLQQSGAAGNEQVALHLNRLLARQQAERNQVRLIERQVSRVVETQRDRQHPDYETWPIADFVVMAEVPQLQPVQRRIGARMIPSDIVELRLPPTASVRVSVLGPDGAPLLLPCRVVLQRTAGDTPDEATLRLDELCALRAEKPTGVAPVEFMPVGLGMRFDVHLRFEDNDFNFSVRDQLGPMHAAERLDLSVRMPSAFAMVSGRLVDGGGRALAGIDAELFVAGSSGRVEGEEVEISDDSRFDLPVRLQRGRTRNGTPGTTHQGPFTLEVLARVGDRRYGRLLPLPDLRAGARAELGDVRLVELPVLAHGVVRDDRGTAVRNASVVVQAMRGDAWHEESFVRTNSDEEGRFRIHAEQRPQRLRLRVSARGHASEYREVGFGEEVAITLLRTSAIRARGQLPTFVPNEAVIASLQPIGGSKRDVRVQHRGNGRFDIRESGLRPGTYRMSLRIRGLLQPIAVAETIVLEPGETVRPPAIDGLDLSGRLFRYEITAADQDGKELSGFGSPLLVKLFDAAGSAQMVPFTWRGNKVELVTTDASIEVVGLRSGFRPARDVLSPGASRLVMRRVHPIRLHLPGLRALLGPDQAARISLVFVGDTGLPGTDVRAFSQRSTGMRDFPRAALGKASGATLGETDEVSMLLMLNGRYDIVLRIDGPGGRVSKSIGSVEFVVDGPQPPVATVAPHVPAVRDALGELRSRPPRTR